MNSISFLLSLISFPFFVTCIPKVKKLVSLGDIRPISLVVSLNKLVAKVLDKRLGNGYG